MGTQTPNYDLNKPSKADNVLISVLNQNMDKLDTILADRDAKDREHEESIAIVAEGNTHIAIASGQYVYVRGHDTLDEGLYIATGNISVNATLSDSNLSIAVSGGLNNLKSQIDSLSSNVSQMGASLGSAIEAIPGLNHLNASVNNPDFNNLTNPGIYYVQDVASATHAPQVYYGYLLLMVIKIGEIIVQELIGGRQTSIGAKSFWRRYYYGGEWKEWIEYYPAETVNSKIKDYDIGFLNSDSSITDQLLAYVNTYHKNESGFTVRFQITQARVPSGLPSNEICWKYGYGELKIRSVPDNGISDGTLILYSFNENRIAIKTYANNTFAVDWEELLVKNSGGFTSYTPSITAGSGFAVDNVTFNYKKQGQMLFVSGRFNITDYGEAGKNIVITLPTGITAYSSGAGSCGNVTLNKNYSGFGLSVRCDGGTYVYIQSGAGGYSTDLIGTGYVVLDFTCFVQ